MLLQIIFKMFGTTLYSIQRTVPEFKEFSMTENEGFGLVFAKTGSINPGRYCTCQLLQICTRTY